METLIIKQYILYRVKAKIKFNVIEYITILADMYDAYRTNY